MSKLDLSELYHQILTELQADKRPRIELSSEQVQALIAQAEVLLAQNSPEATKSWEQWLCVVNYTAQLHRELVPALLGLLETQTDTATLIYGLSALQKHLIHQSQRSGDRVPMQAIQTLRKLLATAHVEVLEWTLRTIEQLGTQSLLLKPDILKIKPKWLFFNKSKKHCRELIQLIEQRWP